MDGNENAKKEFLEHVGSKKVSCAEVYGSNFNNFLPICYTEEEYKQFLDNLDFSYDSGYGGQNIEGTIWYIDGTWSERKEYDGMEWWTHKKVPIVPEYLRQKKS